MTDFASAEEWSDDWKGALGRIALALGVQVTLLDAEGQQVGPLHGPAGPQLRALANAPSRNIPLICEGALVGTLVVRARSERQFEIVRELGSLILQNRQALLLNQKLTETVGVLASGIAHNFNNLLMGIMGGISLAKSTLSPEHPASEVLQVAETSSERAANLTQQLLDYAGKNRPVITDFDLSNLTAAVLETLNKSIPGHIRIVSERLPPLPWMEADPAQIEQVIANLVMNGVEAIGKREGTVQVCTGVSPAPACRATEVFLEVTDSGPGMSTAIKSRIFDPFFTTKFLGRGLGLAAVSGIVRAHHGRMRVESVVGEGTTFKVFFPAVCKPTGSGLP